MTFSILLNKTALCCQGHKLLNSKEIFIHLRSSFWTIKCAALLKDAKWEVELIGTAVSDCWTFSSQQIELLISLDIGNHLVSHNNLLAKLLIHLVWEFPQVTQPMGASCHWRSSSKDECGECGEGGGLCTGTGWRQPSTAGHYKSERLSLW